MRKSLTFLNKLNCFDPAEENDGAVDFVGQREPRSLDESRHTDIVLTIMDDDPEMSTTHREVNSVHDLKKANATHLANMLDVRRDVTVTPDDDLLSGGSGDEARSCDRTTGIRWGSHRRRRNFSTQSLDGRGNMGGGCNRKLMKGTPRELAKRSGAKDVRKHLRNSSLRRTMERISNRRSIREETLAGEIDDSGDASDRTKGTLLDLSDMGESTELKLPSNDYQSIDEENEKVKKPFDNEGQLLANFDKPRHQAETTTPLLTTIAPVPPDNRTGTELMTLPASGNLPTLRRTLSTSALEALPRSILKIGDSLAASHPQRKREKLVRFDRVEMREFDRTVGDNPSVTSGVPIGLDWRYNPNPLVKNLEDYESDRAPRRSKRELALDPTAREHMLLRDWGLTFRELNKVTIEADALRQQRYKSAVQNPILQKRDEILETTMRRVSRVLNGGKKREQAQKAFRNPNNEPYEIGRAHV